MEMHMQPEYLRGLFDGKYITNTTSFLGGITLSVYDSRHTFIFDVTVRIGNDWRAHNMASDVLGKGNGMATFVAFVKKKQMLHSSLEV
jgi:hypothetical protein